MASFDGVLSAAPATDLTFSVEKQRDVNKSVKIFASRNGVLVGVIYVSFFAASLKHAAYIQYFYVPPEARGTGVAIALLQEARRYAKEERPELRWLLADVRWPGSLAVMEQAYGPHAIASPHRMDTQMPIADWDGVRDGPSQQFAWVVDRKTFRAALAEFGPLSNDTFLQLFTHDTNYRVGSKLKTVRRQQ